MELALRILSCVLMCFHSARAQVPGRSFRVTDAGTYELRIVTVCAGLLYVGAGIGIFYDAGPSL